MHSTKLSPLPGLKATSISHAKGIMSRVDATGKESKEKAEVEPC